jgi:hypothetical protein
MIEKPIVRIAVAQTVQNFVDDPWFLWKDGCTDEEAKNLKRYLKNKGIKTPKIPIDESRAEDVKKSLYLAWAALECLDCMVGLLGEE